MDSAFLNLIRGSRITAYMGLNTSNNNQNLKFGPSYQYVEVSVKHFLKDGEVELDKASPNQHLEIIPDCTINVRGSQPVLVQYNPLFQQYGNVSFGHLVWPGEGPLTPSYYVSFRKGMSLEDVKWAVRLSLLA